MFNNAENFEAPSKMFKNLETIKFPRLKPLQQRKRKLFLLALFLVSTNLLLYGLVVDNTFLPAVLQSNLIEFDKTIYNKTILSLLSQFQQPSQCNKQSQAKATSINSGNETYLPPTVVPRAVWVNYGITWRNLSLPILTSKPLGRLGNIMGEYASLYALHRHYNVTVLLHPQMKLILGNIFPNLTIPDFPVSYDEVVWQTVSNIGTLYNYAPIELAASGLLGAKHFEIGNFPFEIQLFHRFKKELKAEFTFTSSITVEVHKFLSNVTETWKAWTHLTPVFIAFHVRRTDYAAHARLMFGAQLPGINYFQRAMTYYREKFGNATVFVAASDDKKFLKSKLGGEKDVFLASGKSPAHDMAMLSSCNHSIITMGSYGFWTGYLTGGEVVYPDVPTTKDYRFSRKMFEKADLRFIALPVT